MTDCRWPLWLMAAGVLTAAAATNPSRDELLASMGSRLVGKQGFWTGLLGLPLSLLCVTDCQSQHCLPRPRLLPKLALRSSRRWDSPQRPGLVGCAAYQA